MPFKVTNHPPRPRQPQSSIQPRKDSGSSDRPSLVNQSGVNGENNASVVDADSFAFEETPHVGTIDQAEHISLHSGTEETACSSQSSVGDHSTLKPSVKNMAIQQQHLSHHNPLHENHFPHSHTSEHQRKDHVGEQDHYEARVDRISVSMRSSDLSLALGPDNDHFTTEIEDIPCAGVRIAFGPLAGLLAWRLVVRQPLTVAKHKRSWWGTSEPRSDMPHSVSPLQDCSGGTTTFPEKQPNLRSSRSAASLPLSLHGQDQKQSPDMHHRQYSEAQHPLALRASSSQAIVANFILDTSSPFSIISRDTLAALGYSLSDIPLFHKSQTSPFHRETEPMVTLSVQNIRTQFRIACEGEASRLGVQFMQDANVSLFFPREHGIGPILYYDSAPPLLKIPATVPLSLHHHYRPGKLSLQQRIRLIFGFST